MKIKKILIVSPHFPPINAPDHQRVRMALPYFRNLGWEPTVLAVHEDYVEGVRDELLEKTYPGDIEIIKTKALPLGITRKFCLGSLGLRALPYLWREGDRLLSSRKFDLVFFSTTMFVTMALGPVWKKAFHIPYVLDLQDPWLSDYYITQGVGKNPPGGKLKYGFSQVLARILEPYTMKTVSHVISVSPAYPEMLKNRYPWLKDEQFTVLPFGAPETDLEYLKKHPIHQRFFDPQDGNKHWVCVGACGHSMDFALKALFNALHKARAENLPQWNRLRMHFIGTSYAPNERAPRIVESIVRDCGVEDIVAEHPSRIPYFEALQCLCDADVLIVPGSDDAGYTASRIYPYVLAQKPLLAILHEQSSAVKVLKECAGAEVVTFCSATQPGELVDRTTEKIQGLIALSQGSSGKINWPVFKEFTAQEMTRKLSAIFDRVLALPPIALAE